jgi:serine/threonine protein kinase
MSAAKKVIYLKGKSTATTQVTHIQHRPKVQQTFQPGEELADGYIIDEVIAQGGSGIVVKAHKPSVQPPIFKAIKVINPFAVHSNDDRLDLQQEFYDEARISSQIGSDPYAISVEDILELPGGTRALVCPFIDGHTLYYLCDTHLRRHLLVPVDITAFIFHRCLSVLDHARERGIPHRDISPTNIMVQRTGVPMMLDWGAGSEINEGILIGKPGYVAPELIREPEMVTREGAFKADIFSMGALLREMLCGYNILEYMPPTSPDYSSDEALGFRMQEDLAAIPSVYDVCKDVPKGLSDVIDACLQSDPSARPDAEALYDYVGTSYLYSNQVGYGMTAETLRYYLSFFHSRHTPEAGLPDNKIGRNMVKIINSQYRRLAERAEYASSILADVAAQNQVEYRCGNIWRSLEKVYSPSDITEAMRNTLLAALAREYPDCLENPQSLLAEEYNQRAEPIYVMDQAGLKQALIAHTESLSKEYGGDASGLVMSSVCANIRDHARYRGYYL